MKRNDEAKTPRTPPRKERLALFSLNSLDFGANGFLNGFDDGEWFLFSIKPSTVGRHLELSL